jgi:hypothetical protein
MRLRGQILYSGEGHRGRYETCALHAEKLRFQILNQVV